jgi:hypothetical protein
MSYGKITTVDCDGHMKHINILFEQNSELFNVKAGNTYSYHCTLNN